MKHLKLILSCIILFALCLGIFVFLQERHDFIYENYKRKKLNVKIISVINEHEKFLNFCFDAKMCITSYNINDTLKIGDSISKPANSWVFDVFRKDESGIYRYYKTFNLEQ